MTYINSNDTGRKERLLKEVELLKDTVLEILDDIIQRIKTEHEQESLNREILHKTEQLKELNKELYAIAHIAGNDLKSSLRKIYSFAEITLRDEGASMTSRAKSYCRKIQAAAQKMNLFTDDLGSLTVIDPKLLKKE